MSIRDSTGTGSIFCDPLLSTGGAGGPGGMFGKLVGQVRKTSVIPLIGNGDLNNIENSKDAHRTYQGRGLIILRITDLSATVTVKASSPGLEAATVVLSPKGLAK